ncbi:double-CXXCG motif protein [Archangium violaceum]|uniref:SitI6 family double-CXXCG motif immunity protein n=1 Tax=Archangium violaceum TaxID=83451 RepID=UPI00193C63EA|nr:double-CXXCG motif protein [Archangium violaceum]QRK08753.1 double-CXXCG motif protein [Archangium violaceum]
MRHFRITEDSSSGYTGHVDAVHKWLLPGILTCPGCRTTWGGGSKAYPSVDLTPVVSLADFEEARASPIEEYEKMCELVRLLLPPGALLEPGAGLGPLVGNARGRFGPLVSLDRWWLLVQREALERLQSEGLRGLKGCRTELRFRQRKSPELLELEILPVGRTHPDCLPPERKPPCPRCHRMGLSLPEELLLDASTLPSDRDLFRLEDFSGVIVCTRRFVDACQRLGLDGVAFKPLPSK